MENEQKRDPNGSGQTTPQARIRLQRTRCYRSTPSAHNRSVEVAPQKATGDLNAVLDEWMGQYRIADPTKSFTNRVNSRPFKEDRR